MQAGELVSNSIAANNWSLRRDTPLHVASRHGLTGAVQSLIKEGADLDVKDYDGNTALYFAIENKHKNIAELLITSGADTFNLCDDKNWIPLHCASRYGWIEVAQLLIKEGADLNARDSYDGHTPLHVAIKYEHKDIAELLITSGADINLCDDDHWTPLHCASWYGCTEEAQLLIKEGADLNVRDSSHGHTPLHAALESQHKDIAEFLITSGADINVCDDEHWTPLHSALWCGCTEAAKSLIKKGADLNARNFSHGHTPLHVAIENQYKDIAELLITSGADINLCDNENWTPLHLASRFGCTELVQSLIRKGADLNARTSSDGNTPLHAAIINRDTNIAELLVNAGADINLRNANNSRTPLSYLILVKCNAEVVRFFIENGAYVESYAYYEMVEKSTLKGSILQNIKICSQALINKFNNLRLPELYNLPMVVVERLPPINKLKIALSRGITRDIEQAVAQEVRAKGHCNLLEVRPLILRIFCVESLIKYFSDIKTQ